MIFKILAFCIILSNLYLEILVENFTVDASSLESFHPVNISVPSGHYVKMECQVENISHSSWYTHNLQLKGMIFVGVKPLRQTEFRNAKILVENYTLTLDSTGHEDEGSYLCQEHGNTIAKYSLQVTGQTNNSQVRMFEQNKNIEVLIGADLYMDCPVTDASSSVWMASNRKVNSIIFAGLNPVREGDMKNAGVLPNNYTLIINSTRINDERLYTCMEKRQTVAEYAVIVIVKPVLRIQHNGQNITSGILVVRKGDNISLDCVAFRNDQNSRLKLFWYIGNITLDNESIEFSSRNRYIDETYNIAKRLVHHISANVSLACQAMENNNISETKNIFLSINEKLPARPLLQIETLYIVCVCLTLRVLFWSCVKLMTCVVHRITRRKSRCKMKPPVSPPDTDQRCSTHDSSLIFIENVVYSLPGHETESHEFTSFSSPSVNNDYGIPVDQDTYSLPIKCEPVNLTHIFHVKEIRSMKAFMDGHVMVRWLGSLQTRDEAEMAFIVTRSKEDLWLVQEFITCQSLFDHISMTSNGAGAKNSPDPDLNVYKLLNFTLQVCLGTEFLIENGFSIPACSTKKILLTNQQICKFHEFCSTEDAPKVVEHILAKPRDNIFSHPVECVTRNEYTKASDVWYAAITIWEIFCGGLSPFGLADKNEFKHYSLKSLEKPLSCPTSIYNCIISCCSDDHFNRPNIKALRFTLEKTVKNFSQ